MPLERREEQLKDVFLVPMISNTTENLSYQLFHLKKAMKAMKSMKYVSQTPHLIWDYLILLNALQLPYEISPDQNSHTFLFFLHFLTFICTLKPKKPFSKKIKLNFLFLAFQSLLVKAG